MAERETRARACLLVRTDERVDAPRRPAFLQLRSLRMRVEGPDGWVSEEGTWDFVERPVGLDAVVVVVFRRVADGVEVLLRQGLRVPASLGRPGQPRGPGRHPAVFIDEIVAGLIEDGEASPSGRIERARQEVEEETGLHLPSSVIEPLGGPLWATPGVCAEQLYYFSADATGVEAAALVGDGSPFEALAQTIWLPLDEAIARACGAGTETSGESGDLRAELGLRRLAARLKPPVAS